MTDEQSYFRTRHGEHPPGYLGRNRDDYAAEHMQAEVREEWHDGEVERVARGIRWALGVALLAWAGIAGLAFWWWGWP